MAQLPHFDSVKDHVMIRGFSQQVRNLAGDVDIRAVVSALTFGHLDPVGREITDIGNLQRKQPDISVRLDRQSNTSDGSANLQIQVNNSALSRIKLNRTDGTTIAQVIVPAAVYQAAFSCHEFNVRAHLENVVRSALLQSSDSFGYQFNVIEG